jgi:hypothetical protein
MIVKKNANGNQVFSPYDKEIAAFLADENMPDPAKDFIVARLVRSVRGSLGDEQLSKRARWADFPSEPLRMVHSVAIHNGHTRIAK